MGSASLVSFFPPRSNCVAALEGGRGGTGSRDPRQTGRDPRPDEVASTIDTKNLDNILGAGKIDGVIVPGGFGERGVEGKIACVEHARTRGVPYLGICLGFQVAVIELARHAAGLSGANSTEFDARCAHPVISELPEQKKIEGLGGTMRLGAHDVLLEPETLAWHLFEPGESGVIRQRFRHRWEVDPAYIDRLYAAGLRFSGRHPSQPIMQVLELPPEVHPYFIAAQFHPELTSRPLAPHPMFMGLVAAGIARANPAYAVAPEPPSAARWLWSAAGNGQRVAVSSVAAANRRS